MACQSCVSLKYSVRNSYHRATHCTKNNLNLRKKAKSVTAWSRCNDICLAVGHTYLALKSDIYRCNCSNRDRLSFYAEMQNLLGECRDLYKEHQVSGFAMQIQNPIALAQNCVTLMTAAHSA